MEKRYVISVLVNNHAGVLSRLSGLFSRRGYNIDSVTVGMTENPAISRMTVVVTEDERTLEQIVKQLQKQIDVRHVETLLDQKSIQRELALLKVNNKDNVALRAAVETSRVRVVDVGKDTVTVQITGTLQEVEEILEKFSSFGLLEIARTGAVALNMGDAFMSCPKGDEE